MAWRLARIDNMVQAHAWMRAQLADDLGKSIEVVHHPGQPPSSPTHPYLFLSFARRGQWVVAGWSEKPIGVDIEIIERSVPMPLRVLHQAEQEWILVGDAHMRFYQMWTAKEAYLKALCVGLQQEPSATNCLALWQHFMWQWPQQDVVACCYN